MPRAACVYAVHPSQAASASRVSADASAASAECAVPRTATIAGTAIYKAVDKIIEKSTRIAAHLLESAAEDIEFKDGKFMAAK